MARKYVSGIIELTDSGVGGYYTATDVFDGADCPFYVKED